MNPKQTLKAFTFSGPMIGFSCVAALLIGIGLSLMLASCGGGDPAAQDLNAEGLPKYKPNWTYQPDGLNLRVKADALLNLYDNIGHTAILCVYQLSDPNKFNSTAKTRDGLVTLLDCSKAFDASAVTFEKIIVQPGEDKVFVMPRAEKAMFVGVVAGFYDLDPARCARLFKYPVISQDEGFFTTDMVRTPGKLVVNLLLGPVGIQQIGSE